MKTTIVVLSLLALVVSATVASAADGYTAYVQQAYRQQQADQARAAQQFDKTFSDVEKSMPSVATSDFSGFGTGWGTAAAAGGTRGPSQTRGWTTCPGY